jgi:TRAP-type C4-dicarboxylate transport system permease large subunit
VPLILDIFPYIVIGVAHIVTLFDSKMKNYQTINSVTRVAEILKCISIGVTKITDISNRLQVNKAKEVPLGSIYKGILPFVITDIIRVALIFMFPALALYLPSLM